MKIHELKTWPGPFEAVASGRKTHEVRAADRPFQAGDVLRLREWDPRYGLGARPGPMGYTGREVYVEVTYMTDAGQWGLPGPRTLSGGTYHDPGVCCMSIRLLSQEAIALVLGAEKAGRK